MPKGRGGEGESVRISLCQESNSALKFVVWTTKELRSPPLREGYSALPNRPENKEERLKGLSQVTRGSKGLGGVPVPRLRAGNK